MLEDETAYGSEQESTNSITSEQNELMARMKKTIGVASSAIMESHIKFGTIGV